MRQFSIFELDKYMYISLMLNGSKEKARRNVVTTTYRVNCMVILHA